MFGRPNIRQGCIGCPSFDYDPEVDAYVSIVTSRGGTVSDAVKLKLNNFIIYLRDTNPSGNQWQYIQRFKYLKNTSEVAALTDIKAPSSAIGVAVNSPSFTPDGGYLLNGTSQYIRSGFVPSTDGGSLFTSSNCSFGSNRRGYTNDANFRGVCGCSDGVNNTWFYSHLNFGMFYWINAPTGNAYNRGGTGNGAYMMGRSGPGTKFLLPAGSSTDGGMPSGGLPTNEMFIGSLNNNGTAVNFDNGYKDWWFAGSYSLDFSVLQYAIDTFL